MLYWNSNLRRATPINRFSEVWKAWIIVSALIMGKVWQNYGNDSPCKPYIGRKIRGIGNNWAPLVLLTTFFLIRCRS